MEGLIEGRPVISRWYIMIGKKGWIIVGTGGRPNVNVVVRDSLYLA